ncbi:MAG: hypothetical protein SPE61_08290, partial [Campylobacter sp.]|nr:hypothetical protein [Campylobacter sp.]
DDRIYNSSRRAADKGTRKLSQPNLKEKQKVRYLRLACLRQRADRIHNSSNAAAGRVSVRTPPAKFKIQPIMF